MREKTNKGGEITTRRKI